MGDGDDEGDSGSSASDFSTDDTGSDQGSGRKGEPKDGDCRLYHLLASSLDVFPRSHLLVLAHLQLDALDGGTKWTTVWQALRQLTAQASPDRWRGDEKSYRRLNVHLSFPFNSWTGSIKRLLARLDFAISTLRGQESLQWYSSKLVAEEKKAFNACVQVWRKSARGRAMVEEGQEAAPHHLFTSLEASILCRQDGQDCLVLCLPGKALTVPQLKTSISEAIGLLPGGQCISFGKVEVCADSEDAVQAGVQAMLESGSVIRSLTLRKHGVEAAAVGRNVGLPPLITQHMNLSIVNNYFPASGPDLSIPASVCKKAMLEHIGQSGAHPPFQQPSKLASLAVIASLIVRRHGLDTASLPAHLKESTNSATTCSSCKRPMSIGRTLNQAGRSLEFQQQALFAGFKLTGPVSKEILDILSTGKAYLPPLDEVFCLYRQPIRYVDGALQFVPPVERSTVDREQQLVHVSSSTLSPDEQKPASHWQFCPYCAASHLGVVQETHCGCFVCDREQRDCSHASRWWRYRRDANSMARERQT